MDRRTCGWVGGVGARVCDLFSEMAILDKELGNNGWSQKLLECAQASYCELGRNQTALPMQSTT